MEYVNEKLAARLVVKDRPTVREQLLYQGCLASSRGEDMFIWSWKAAKPLITEFDCPNLKIDDDIDEIDNPQAVDVIIWAGAIVHQHMRQLDEVPKNS